MQNSFTIQNIQYSIKNLSICLVGRVFDNGLGDQDLIPGHVIPKTLKTVLDTS